MQQHVIRLLEITNKTNDQRCIRKKLNKSKEMVKRRRKNEFKEEVLLLG